VYRILDEELAGHLDSVPHLPVQERDNLLIVTLIVGHFLNGRNAFKVGRREYFFNVVSDFELTETAGDLTIAASILQQVVIYFKLYSLCPEKTKFSFFYESNYLNFDQRYRKNNNIHGTK
jgi:hypothetical protein